MSDPIRLPSGGPGANLPLCVDLDGTLIRSDLLWESLVVLLKQSPWLAFVLPFWLLGGRAALKRQIASRASVNAAALPYNKDFLTFLRREKELGRKVFLVTAADAQLAGRVAEHIGIFEGVLASDGRSNLKGAAKADALTTRFGARGFDYAGDSRADLPVWAAARGAILVDVSAAQAGAARARANVVAEFPGGRSLLKAMVRMLRPHQWVKNLIVLVPLMTSHQLGNPSVIKLGGLAMAAFCLCASAVYMINDLLDLEADRQHPTKCHRPLAAGDISLVWAMLLAPALILAGFGLALSISMEFTGVLVLYVTMAFAYTWWVKRKPLLDIFVLAGLYTLRLIAGHAATNVAYSEWLLAFSMFLFLSLALVKRFQEVRRLAAVSTGRVLGRGYSSEDLAVLTPLGAASGYLAVLVLALYVNSDKVRLLYHRPTLLLLICPLMLYWISRVWLVAHRGGMNDDPVVFALKDKPSHLTGALTLLVVWLAT